MKAFLSAIAILVAIVSAEDVLTEETEEIILDEDQFKELFACMMDKAPCSEKYQTYRDNVPDYIKTTCAECDPKQKELYLKYYKMAQDMYPDEHQKLMETYGPKS